MKFQFVPVTFRLVLVVGWLYGQGLHASDWPQFRGTNGSGVSQARNLLVEFGPNRNVVWKINVPAGLSSPILAGNRLFLTAHEDKKRLVLCLNRQTGKVLWQREIMTDRTEPRHVLNDPTSPSPVTDGESVYAFFPEFGLISYGSDGKERWRVPLGPFETQHGMSGSPILADGQVVLLVDQIKGSYLAAFNKADGSLKWKSMRPDLAGGYSTPVVYRGAIGPAQVIVSGARELASYSAGTGEKLWWLNGLPYLQLTVPVLDRDTIYVNVSGIPTDLSLEGWFQQLDKNKDGKIQLDEFPTMMGGTRTGTILDRDKDGAVDATEFKLAIDPLKGESSLWAVRLGGWGSLAEANVRWRATKGLPEVSSPLLYKDVLYQVKNGGILTTLNPATGEVLKQGRLQGALGEYFASPVAADNQVFTVSGEGKVTVLKAGGEWEILAVNDLGEDCYTTPAITGGRIYIRTRSSLYSFGKR